MPLVSTMSKDQLDARAEAIKILEAKCRIWRLEWEEAEDVFVFWVCGRQYSDDNGEAMVAIAKFGKSYAMITPEYLTEKQLVVFEHLLRNIGADEKIIVFSQRDYDAVKKYLYGKKNKITLRS